jgi:hypothetical protein
MPPDIRKLSASQKSIRSLRTQNIIRKETKIIACNETGANMWKINEKC